MASSCATSANDYTSFNNIDQLPDEILMNIFQLLPKESILTCEQVSERWKRLARDPYIWRRIKIVITDQPGYLLESSRSLEIVNSHSEFICNLRVTYVYRCQMMKSILNSCQKSNLVSLELWMCRLREDIQDNLKFWRNLKKLSFRNSMLLEFDDDVAIPYDQFEHLNCLELSEFGLNNNNFSTLLKLKHLRDITIDKIKHLGIQNMIDLINSKTEILETLRIYGGNQVDDHVLKMLSECPNLKILSIRFCQELTDTGLVTLINMKKIEQLQIWNNSNFTEKCLLSVLGNVSMFHLSLLSLSRIKNLSPSIIDIICSKYTNLKFLALYKCPKLVLPDEHEERLREKFGDFDLIYH